MARIIGISGNLNAFLDMICHSENGSYLDHSDDGYNILAGGKVFPLPVPQCYATHPNILNAALDSTAAGRYQLLHRWYVPYAKLLKLNDFTPESQDLIAIQQIRERHALPDIESGDLPDAIDKCSNIWASLPGNDYGQHKNSIEFLQTFFLQSGGIINA